MKKLFIPLCLILLLTACSCKHEWTPATCTEPQTCEKCGMVEGEALGHSWTEATCTEPETCQLCGETKGEALGHISGPELFRQVFLTPYMAEIMTSNGIDQTPLGSILADAAERAPEPTCTTPGRCDRCGEEIPALGHAFIGRQCNRCGVDTE